VHRNEPQTIAERKATVTAKIREIPKEACVRVNFARRVQVCLQPILEHIWNRTWLFAKRPR